MYIVYHQQLIVLVGTKFFISQPKLDFIFMVRGVTGAKIWGVGGGGGGEVYL